MGECSVGKVLVSLLNRQDLGTVCPVILDKIEGIPVYSFEEE